MPINRTTNSERLVMKKIIFCFSLILVFSGCSGLSTHENGGKSFVAKDIPRAWRNSYHDWLTLKQDYQGNYNYERDAKYATNFNSSTKFEVINDQVEYRHFFEWQTGNSPSISWTESYADLGAHDQGSPARTIDQLYHQCKSEILNQAQSKYSIQFKVDAFNVIKECSYTKKQCNSQCTKGIRIQGLSMQR